MDLRQLRYFLGIVEAGSLSRAAETLHIAQPALSQHLKRLEEDFGCPLVLRTPRGVVPTDSGRRLAERAATLLREVDALHDAVRGVEATPAGPARIGIPSSLGAAVTVPVALAVRRLYPAVRLRVMEGLSGHMPAWILSGQLDCAVVFAAAAPPGLVLEPVARERLVLVAARSDDAAVLDQPAAAFAAVAALPLILPGRPHGVREEVEQAAAICRLTVAPVMEIDSLDQIKALVAAGVGYTILSQRLAAAAPMAEALRTVPIIAPVIERTIALAQAGDRPLPVAARVVRALVHDRLSALFRALDGGAAAADEARAGGST